MQKTHRLVAAAVAACTLASGTAFADCTFHPAQDVEILSTHWNDVLVYNYSNTGASALGPAFGNRTAAYAAPKEQWLGAFLYDYTIGAYVEAQYSLIDLLYQVA